MGEILIIYTELLKESWFLYLNLTLGGLIAGSFCTMLIYRLPLIIQQEEITQQDTSMSDAQNTLGDTSELSLAFPGSHCPSCGKSIPVYVNLPLLGYLIARGKCLRCSANIAWFYPLTEILCVAVALLAGWAFGPSPILLPLLLLFWSLIALSIIDLRSGLLPDQLTLGVLWAGLLLNSLMPYASLYQAVVGVVSAYLFLSLVNLVYYAARRRIGIGGGDIKLFVGLGAYFGWQGLLPLLFLASVSGLVYFCILALLGIGKDGGRFGRLDESASTTKQSESIMLSEQRWGPHIALAAIIYMLLFHLFPDLLKVFIPFANLLR